MVRDEKVLILIETDHRTHSSTIWKKIKDKIV